MKNCVDSPLAGRWFSADGVTLKKELAGYGQAVPVTRREQVCAAIVPHAGYPFSGRIAAGVYQSIDPTKLKRVVVLGPSHYVFLPNQISLQEATHFRTPLGEVPVDTAFVEQLRKLPFITYQARAHDREHSDQIQLPLIQSYLGPALPVVCLVCGQFGVAEAREAGAALRNLLDDQTLVVVSTDFTHYGSNYDYVPFTQDIQKNIEALDMQIFAALAEKDLPEFHKRLERTGATVCGRDPLMLLLAMLPKQSVVTRTGYDTSGRMMHDEQNSVSYLGAIVTGHWSERASGTQQAHEGHLSSEVCQQLLLFARQTLVHAFDQGERAAATQEPASLCEALKAVRGGFVTLNLAGHLRGCIGEIFPRQPIWKVVREQALNAAFHDPRFEPLRAAELARIQIEISILTPPRPVASWRDIQIGTHGMVLNKNGRVAVFLPQVAPEQGWDLAETLTHLALKAGLPPEAWREGASFLVFEAQVVRERSAG